MVKRKACTAIPTPKTVKRCGHLDTHRAFIAKLNRLRQWMIKTDSRYLTQQTSILSTTATSIAIQKGYVTSAITNIVSPVRDWPSFRDVADFNILLAAKY